MAQITVAIVGTGTIARIHAEALQSLNDQAELVAAADIDAGPLKDFCSEFHVPAGYASLASLLAAGPPDLVHVCTPPGTHVELARGCLEAGSSVLVEKPPSLSLAGLAEMTSAQGAGDLGAGGPWFATVFQHRFGSGAQRLRAMIRGGVLGRPLLAVCHTTWFRDQEYFDVPWRGRWDTEGGGPTMGHGIHQMDLLAYLLGDWSEISAMARRQARRMETEDLSLAHVTFASGAAASVINSVLSPRQESYLRFDFERATVEVSHLYGYGDEDWQITPAPGYEQEVKAAWEAGPKGERSGHRAQFAAVLRSLREGSPPPVTPDEARRTMTLVAGIYASAFLGHPVRPADLGPDSPFYHRMNGSGAPWQ
jgi:predicted dehydrogenase